MRKKKKLAKKVVRNHTATHHVAPPKPPSRFLWIMEAVFVSLAVFAVLATILILYLAATNHRKAQDAVKTVTSIIPTQTAEDDYEQVRSKLGFEITVNTKLQQAEGVITVGENKEVKSGKDVFLSANYSTVNVYKNINDYATEQSSALELTRTTYVSLVTSNKKAIFEELRQKFGQSTAELELAEKFFSPDSDQNVSYKLVKSEEANINGVHYRKNIYEITHNDSFKYKTKQTDYITVQNNRPYKATLYENVGSQADDIPQFNAVINSLKLFQPDTAAISQFRRDANIGIGHGSSFIDGFVAHAAEKPISTDPEIQVVAKNQPAVVRIASAYCPDFELKLGTATQSFSGGCSASFGSGFIITPDGYVGTNGHVVRSTAAEVLAVSIAVGNQQIIKSYLNFLVKAGLITQTTADNYAARAASGDKTALKTILGSLADPDLDATQVRETKQDGVYAIQLSNEAVKFDLKNLRNFNFDSNIIKAKLVDSDYDPYANVEKEGFRTSDVALLKIENGSNYPYNSLGSIQGLGQGSTLTVIGFPGAAENELVNKEESVPTPTKGTVSAIRTASGTSNKLIQSDVSIAKGNSGGPAYNENGEVVGIATYGVTDEKSGGTQFNYMRDIADLKSLIKKNSINIPTVAEGTEKLWEQGLANFSKAYYSSAITDFQKLKSAYPPHRLADDFIARAEEAKKQGKEATPPEVYYTIIAVVAVVIIIPAIVLFFVIRHHHKRREAHDNYLQNNGSAPPPPPAAGNPPISVNPAVAPSNVNQTPPPQNRSVDMLSNAPISTQSPTPTSTSVPVQVPGQNNLPPTPPT